MAFIGTAQQLGSSTAIKWHRSYQRRRKDTGIGWEWVGDEEFIVGHVQLKVLVTSKWKYQGGR